MGRKASSMKERSKAYELAKATYDNWPQWKRDAADQWFRPQKEPEPNYPDAVDGDIYLNPFFGDMWIVDGKNFIKINDGCTIDIDEPEGFIKVGHVDGVINKKEV